MEYFYKCPKCNDSSYADIIPSIGRLLECPYCKNVFPFSSDRLVGEGTKYGPVKYYSEEELTKLLHNVNNTTIVETKIQASDSNQYKQEAQGSVKEETEESKTEKIASEHTPVEISDNPKIGESATDSSKQTPSDDLLPSTASANVTASNLNQSEQKPAEIVKDIVGKTPIAEANFTSSSVKTTDIKSNELKSPESIRDFTNEATFEEPSFSNPLEKDVEKTGLISTNKPETDKPKEKAHPETIQYKIELCDLHIPRLQTTETTLQGNTLALYDITPSLRIPLDFKIEQNEIIPIKTEMIPSSHEINPSCINNERK